MAMSSELKKYFGTIGRRGGKAKTAEKVSAVRRNGALGGRPRKDGMPPGSKPLEDVLEEIETSKLIPDAKLELSIWARFKARLFKDGQPWLDRETLVKVNSMIRSGASAARRTAPPVRRERL